MKVNSIIPKLVVVAGFAAGVLLAAPALATGSCNGNGDDCNTTTTNDNRTYNQGGTGIGIAGASSSATGLRIRGNDNFSPRSYSYSGAYQGQGQVAVGKVSVEGDTYNHHQPRNAASGPAVSSNPTANCRVAHGVSVGLVNGNAGVFTSSLDEGCDTREDARFLKEVLGNLKAAERRACAKPELARALGEAACPTPKAGQGAVVPTTESEVFASFGD